MKKEFILLAFRNILRHWRKSFITGSCICLGFTGIILLGGYMIRMERYLTTQGIYLNHTGHIAIYKKGGLERHIVEPQKFSFSVKQQSQIQDALSSRPELERSIPFIHGQGMITNGCKSFPVLAWASHPADEKYLRTHPMVKKDIPLLVNLKKGQGYWDIEENHGIVLTRKLAELLDKPLVLGDPAEKAELVDTIIEDCKSPEANKIISGHSALQFLGNSFEGGLAASDATVLGHYSTGFSLTEDNSVMIPLMMAQEFYGTDRVTSFGIFLKDSSETSEVLNWLEKESKKWNFEIELYPYTSYQVNPFYVGSMRFVYVMNLFFLVIVCGVVILSLLNAIQIAILERKSEIGTLLALGYRRSHIRHLFEMESLILAFVSLIAGAVISWILAIFVNSLHIQFDIVGNADKLIMVLAVEWWLSLIFVIFFMLLAYAATSIICRYRLNIPVVRLLERID